MALKLWFGVVAGVAVVVTAASVQAQSKRERARGAVEVCSRYGNGCTTAAIRPAGNDYEFRMPSGSWYPCQQSCKDAVRREVLDFWETQRENSGDKQ